MSSDKGEFESVDKSGAQKRPAEDRKGSEGILKAEVSRGAQSQEDGKLRQEPKGGEAKGCALKIQLQPKRQRLLDSPLIESPSQIKGPVRPSNTGIMMNLAQKVQESNPVVPVKDESVKAAFGDDDESDNEEEVPELVKIRMRNIGKYTPTSEGPRSYGKTKNGFIDTRLRPNQF